MKGTIAMLQKKGDDVAAESEVIKLDAPKLDAVFDMGILIPKF